MCAVQCLACAELCNEVRCTHFTHLVNVHGVKNKRGCANEGVRPAKSSQTHTVKH